VRFLTAHWWTSPTRAVRNRTYNCWNCERNYTLFREITDEQTLTVACPFCHAEGVVQLQPFRKQKKKTVMRGGNEGDQPPGEELMLPEILPTQKPE